MLSPSAVERKERIKHRHEEYLDEFFSGLHTPDFTDEKGRPKQHLHSMYRKWKDRRVRVEQGPEMLPQINRTANHRLSTSFGALKRLIKSPRRHESPSIRNSVGSIENIVHQAPQSMQQTRPEILQYHEGTPEDPDPEYEYMISRIQEAQENVRSTLAEYDAHQAESGWEDVARDHEVFDIKNSRNESRENPTRRESEVVNFTSFMVTPGMMSPHSIMFYRIQVSSHSERPNAVRSPEISGQFNNQGVHGPETGYTSRGVGTDDVYEGRLTEEPTPISPIPQLPGSDRNRSHRHSLKPPLPLSKRPLLDLGTRQPEPRQRAASAEISRLPSYRTPRRISHSHASPPLPHNPAPTLIDQYTRAEAPESDHAPNPFPQRRRSLWDKVRHHVHSRR
ncbi:hypothetical protein BS50DRAFT_404236 [Corynespora cassiicola Philippines]|uniref:Uncharacterized protein n=1 Tax=Corynespora cassiicola Philippines TaxID=1448308 RepID=A0A2T2NKP6_CORCC|nr:hypothetical protein BS50DRAFT_404236 [Corynespora cassiicola Philippines]